MEEKLKITSKGSLYKKEYGSIKIENKEQVHNNVIIYDKNLDQYCVNNQWEIPFHSNMDDKKPNENKLRNIYYDIKEIKEYFIKTQKWELSALSRSIEKDLLSIIDNLKK